MTKAEPQESANQLPPVLLVIGNVPHNHIMEGEARVRGIASITLGHVAHAYVPRDEACASWAVIKGVTAGGGNAKPTPEELRAYFFLVADCRSDQVAVIVIDKDCWEDPDNVLIGRNAKVSLFPLSADIHCMVSRPLGAVEHAS